MAVLASLMLAWTGFLFLLVHRHLAGFKTSHMATFAGAIFLAAPITEVASNQLYKLVTGHSLWIYHFMPIAQGDTSLAAPVIWSFFGVNLYLTWLYFHRLGLHQNHYLKAAVMGIEGPVWEITMNYLFVHLGYGFIAYYLPAELRHYSSVQAVTIYALSGYVAAFMLLRFRHLWGAKTAAVLYLLGFASLFVISLWP